LHQQRLQLEIYYLWHFGGRNLQAPAEQTT
jgi:hypothetical protein